MSRTPCAASPRRSSGGCPTTTAAPTRVRARRTTPSARRTPRAPARGERVTVRVDQPTARPVPPRPPSTPSEAPARTARTVAPTPEPTPRPAPAAPVPTPPVARPAPAAKPPSPRPPVPAPPARTEAPPRPAPASPPAPDPVAKPPVPAARATPAPPQPAAPATPDPVAAAPAEEPAETIIIGRGRPPATRVTPLETLDADFLGEAPPDELATTIRIRRTRVVIPSPPGEAEGGASLLHRPVPADDVRADSGAGGRGGTCAGRHARPSGAGGPRSESLASSACAGGRSGSSRRQLRRRSRQCSGILPPRSRRIRPREGEGLNADQWLYLLDGAQRGPIDIEDLVDLVLTSIPENTKVWHPGLEGWVLANEARGDRRGDSAAAAGPRSHPRQPPRRGHAGLRHGAAAVPDRPHRRRGRGVSASTWPCRSRPRASRSTRPRTAPRPGSWRCRTVPGSSSPTSACPRWTVSSSAGGCAATRCLSHTPLLFISGSDKYKERYRALQIGADDFLSKQMPIRELLMRIQLLLTKYSDLSADQEAGGHDRGRPGGSLPGPGRGLRGPRSASDVRPGSTQRALHRARRGRGQHRDHAWASARARSSPPPSGPQTGVDAVYAFLAWEKGSFKFTPGDAGQRRAARPERRAPPARRLPPPRRVAEGRWGRRSAGLANPCRPAPRSGRPKTCPRFSPEKAHIVSLHALAGARSPVHFLQFQLPWEISR